MNTTLSSLVGGERPDSKFPSKSKAGRRLVMAIPWALLLGFLLLAWMLFGSRLIPAKSVEIETVVTVRQTSELEGGAIQKPNEVDPWDTPVLFQASGWIEPDPLPIKATALVNGVIDSVSILEGAKVKKGDLLATLIREDFELDLAAAKSELESMQAQAEAHEATIEGMDAQIHTVHMKIKAGNLKCLELEDHRNRMQRAGSGAVAAGEIAAATLRLQTHSAEVHAIESSQKELFSEKKQLEAMRLDFASKVKGAETEVAKRELALSRTEIRSPVDGIVLRLLAVPGQKRMLDMDDADSATVAVLYQPDFLQARIDVPLEEAAQMTVGQAVLLRSNFLSEETFEGTVTRIAGEADLQRNTLQAKVKVSEPDHRLRPDMLCRAEFLAAMADGSGGGPSGTSPTKGRSGSSSGSRVSIFVPESAFVEEKGNLVSLFVIDASGEKIEKREVKVGTERRESHRLVLDGLRPGDRVVTAPSAKLQSGDRVKAARESETKEGL